LALSVAGSHGADLFVYDFQSDNLSARTFTGQDNTWPLWTPDGRHIIFRSTRPKEGLYSIRSDGSGEPQLILDAPIRVIPTSFSPGAKRLAYQSVDPLTANDLWTVPLDWSDPDRPKAGTPELFERTPGNDRIAVFSPDGRWVAYESTVSGRTAIYVRAFPGSGGKWLIADSGAYPLWSSNGRELFYESPGDNRIWVVDCTSKDGVFVAGKPRLWSPAQLRDNGYTHKDLAPDGKRFVMFPMPATQAKESNSVHVTFLLNFFDELRRRVPAEK
jgi:Tol biopolymer transport system component